MAKFYDRKNALVAADMLNDKVVPWFEEEGILLLRILTDRGTEYCRNRDHEFQLFLSLEDIDHSKPESRTHATSLGIAEVIIAFSATLRSCVLPDIVFDKNRIALSLFVKIRFLIVCLFFFPE